MLRLHFREGNMEYESKALRLLLLSDTPAAKKKGTQIIGILMDSTAHIEKIHCKGGNARYAHKRRHTGSQRPG